MNWPEVGGMATGAAFIIGMIKIFRTGNHSKAVSPADCARISGEIHADIKDIKSEQKNQGEMLARVDERTQKLAKSNGLEQ